MFCIQIVDFDILIFPFFFTLFFSPGTTRISNIVSVEVLSSFVWIWIAFLFLALLPWGGYTWILCAPTCLADILRISTQTSFYLGCFPELFCSHLLVARWSASLWKSRLTCHIPWKQETTLTQWSLYCVSAGFHLNLSMSLWGNIELWGVYQGAHGSLWCHS